MLFMKRLREPIKNGEIDTTVRVWKSPRVKVGRRYKLDAGFVVVDKMSEIGLDELSPTIARASGFPGVVDLLKTAKHGNGEKIFLIKFHYDAG
ncbi:MAG: hypothetical protein ACI9ON_002728 [Limisphaerales bacterium]|jgi:hypothetical protein